MQGDSAMEFIMDKQPREEKEGGCCLSDQLPMECM